MTASFFLERDSEFDLSRLSILLAHHSDEWIPPRKAMVMTGETAASEVVEEVYGNDGAERHEAPEASAGAQ